MQVDFISLGDTCSGLFVTVGCFEGCMFSEQELVCRGNSSVGRAILGDCFITLISGLSVTALRGWW